MTPEAAAIRALLYICAAGLSLSGLLVLIAGLWEWQYTQVADGRRQARAVAPEVVKDAHREADTQLLPPEPPEAEKLYWMRLLSPEPEPLGIETAAVTGD